MLAHVRTSSYCYGVEDASGSAQFMYACVLVVRIGVKGLFHAITVCQQCECVHIVALCMYVSAKDYLPL